MYWWPHCQLYFNVIIHSSFANLQLKADKIKLIELAGSSESEFSTVRKSSCLQKVVCTRKIYLLLLIWHIMNAHLITQFQVSTSMKDICFDAFGTTKEKKDPKDVKGNRGRIIFVMFWIFITSMTLLINCYTMKLKKGFHYIEWCLTMHVLLGLHSRFCFLYFIFLIY